MSQAGANDASGGGGGANVQTLTGNSGVATASGNNINVVTANATVKFVGSGSTLTEDFGLQNLNLGSSMTAITSGTANVGYGPGVLGLLTSGINNTSMGNLSMQNATTTQGNSCFGFGAGRALTTGTGINTLIGTGAGSSMTTSTGNCALGEALNLLSTGSYNIGIGGFAGNNYTGAESSNICINNQGVVGESNVMRLGIQGSGNQQVTQTYIAGVINTVSGRVVKITTPVSYPYTTLTTDYVILVDTSSARTITPLASPVTGTTYRIKDNVGSAAANNITITPSGKNIDGAASFVINANYGSVDIVYNGTQWNVL
jgi:hypothetical protein